MDMDMAHGHARCPWCGIFPRTGKFGKSPPAAASPPLLGLAPPARRPRAAGAPWEARARAARVQTAAKTLCGGGGAHTNSELPQAGFP